MTTITKDAVVLMHYTLTNNDGETLDSSADKEPLAYLHGHGNIIPGLEKQLEGKAAGDKVTANIEPADGYGVRDENLMQEVPKEAFQGAPEIVAGMQFQAQGPQGATMVTVTKVEGETVTVDGNHPLADVHLNFDVEIVEIREATAEELSHGHVHGPGGHEH